MAKICYVVTIPTTIKAFFVPQLRFLADNGFDVTVVCSQDPALQEILGDKVKFYPIEIPRGISFKGTIKAVVELKNFFKKEKFELVQYSTPNAAFCSSIAAFFAGIKVRNYHLMGFRYIGAKGVGRELLKLFEKITCLCSTHIECVSRSNMSMGIQENLFSTSKATVVWNGSTGGVDLNRFDYQRKEQWRREIRNNLGLSEKDIVFGFVGRITKDKGIDELLEAFLGLQNQAKLLLIGSLEDADKLNQDFWNCAKHDCNVIIHNAVSDIERYFAALDVLVLPSYREGFGNVVIEAGAMGVPAIVSNIPGPIDIIESEYNGIVVECKNAEALKNALQKIMQEGLLKKLGYNAFEYATSHYDSVILCEKILEQKRRLLGG